MRYRSALVKVAVGPTATVILVHLIYLSSSFKRRGWQLLSFSVRCVVALVLFHFFFHPSLSSVGVPPSRLRLPAASIDMHRLATSLADLYKLPPQPPPTASSIQQLFDKGIDAVVKTTPAVCGDTTGALPRARCLESSRHVRAQ